MGERADGTNRRGFLGVMGRVGITVVGAAAGVVELGRTAFAAPAANWRCCDLAFGRPTCKINSAGSYYCESGTMRTWCCCQGSRTYNCGECTGGSNCHKAPFYCSAGWTSAPNKCVSGCPQGLAQADPTELAQWHSGTYVVTNGPGDVSLSRDFSR
jgi:hypothetical protein